MTVKIMGEDPIVSPWRGHADRRSKKDLQIFTPAIFWLKVRAGWAGAVGVRQYPLGKKEAQRLAAHTVAVGTEWEDLIERNAALTASDVEYQ